MYTVKIILNIISPVSSLNEERCPLYQHQYRSEIETLIYDLLWIVLVSLVIQRLLLK